jgi:hypothetical protein
VFLGDALIFFRRLGVDEPSLSAKKADNGEQRPGGKGGETARANTESSRN